MFFLHLNLKKVSVWCQYDNFKAVIYMRSFGVIWTIYPRGKKSTVHLFLPTNVETDKQFGTFLILSSFYT